MKLTIIWNVDDILVEETPRDNRESKRNGVVSIIESVRTDQVGDKEYVTTNWIRAKAFWENICYTLSNLKKWDKVEATIMTEIGKFTPDGETKEVIFNKIKLISIKPISDKPVEEADKDFDPADFKTSKVNSPLDDIVQNA